MLVLITDGQVGNEDQLLAHLEPRLHGVRVHTVGIDQAVNAGFLNRLASIGRGRSEFVESEDRLDEAMEHIHHRIAAPLATGLTLHVDGLEVIPGSVAPARLGALFPGVPLVIVGRFRGSPSGALSVRGTTSDGTPWEQHATGIVSTSRAATSIWVRAHLRDLEDRYAVGGADDLEQRIVQTSLRFGVLCRFTAFVAVDSRVATDGQTPHQVVQPVESPEAGRRPRRPCGQHMPRSRPPRLLRTPTGRLPQARQSPPAPASGRPLGTPAGRGPTPRRARSVPALTGFQTELSNVLDRLRQIPADQRVHHLLDELLPILDSIVQRMEAEYLDATPWRPSATTCAAPAHLGPEHHQRPMDPRPRGPDRLHRRNPAPPPLLETPQVAPSGRPHHASKTRDGLRRSRPHATDGNRPPNHAHVPPAS